MIIITPPEYHGRKCNVCGEKDACCEINFRNDHHNHGIVVALCRDCVSTLSYLTEEQRGYNFPIREKRMDNDDMPTILEAEEEEQ